MMNLTKFGLVSLFAGASLVTPIVNGGLQVAAQPKPSAKQLADFVKQCQAKAPKNLITAINCNDATVIQQCQKLPKDAAARKKQADLVESCQQFGVLVRLDKIPVFTLVDKNGSPITDVVKAKDKTGKPQDVTVSGFFMGKAEAEAALKKIQQRNKGARLNPLSLKLAFQISEVTQGKITYQFVASEEQAKRAISILQQEGQKGDLFTGIPLFYALGGNGKSKGLLSITRGQQEAIPFYFDHKDLQKMVDEVKKQNSKLGMTAEIKVTSLKKVMNTLLKTPAEAQNIVLIPSSTTQKFLQQRK